MIQKLSHDFSFESWVKIDEDHTAVRFVTSWMTKEENVHQLIQSL